MDERPASDGGSPVAGRTGGERPGQGPLAGDSRSVGGSSSDPGATAAWHRPLHHTPAGSLVTATGQTAGMTRYEAISGALAGSEGIWMGETHVGPGIRSGDHHHGESETGIYVVEGHPVFVFSENGGETRIETAPGDYVYVPPFVPHREENPGAEPAVVVIARSTQEAIVVNLPSLDASEA